MIFELVSTAFLVYRFMLIGYILMSWVPALQESAVGKFLETMCEPYLGFFRKFIPPIGMIDISPIVGLFALMFIQNGVFIVLGYLL